MKKLLILTLTVLTIVSMVGCGANNEKTKEKGQTAQIEQQTENKEQKNAEILLAKVTKTIGNEISVKLSADKFDLPEGQVVGGGTQNVELSDSQMEQLKDGKTIQLEGGGTMGVANGDPNVKLEDDPGINVEDLKKEGITVDEKGNNDIFAAISFDAGAKDFTIPAGVKIFNATTGKDGKLSDIKEGRVVNISVDRNNNTVTRIDILG